VRWLQAATRSCGMTMAMESDVSRRAALGVFLAGAASIPGKRARRWAAHVEHSQERAHAMSFACWLGASAARLCTICVCTHPLTDTALRTATAGAEVLTSFGRNGDADPNKQLKVGGVGMTSVQGTGQTGVRTSAFKKAVLGNSKNAISFPREGMTPVSALPTMMHAHSACSTPFTTQHVRILYTMVCCCLVVGAAGAQVVGKRRRTERLRGAQSF
jgi:hypothetical protein